MSIRTICTRIKSFSACKIAETGMQKTLQRRVSANVPAHDNEIASKSYVNMDTHGGGGAIFCWDGSLLRLRERLGRPSRGKSKGAAGNFNGTASNFSLASCHFEVLASFAIFGWDGFLSHLRQHPAKPSRGKSSGISGNFNLSKQHVEVLALFASVRPGIQSKSSKLQETSFFPRPSKTALRR